MRSANFYIITTILFLLIFLLPTSASAFPKYKVALLPIINTENIKTTEISDLIQYKIHRKLRFPFYEFIPNTEITDAMKVLPIKNGSIIPNQSNLAFLSKTLSADIILVVEINKARISLQNPFSLWNDETIETTDVLLTCYAYSTKDNQYSLFKAGQSNSSSLSSNSGLLHATEPIIDELLKKLPFSTIPSSISTEVKPSTPIIP